ncbi:MAG: hypothetical protein ABIH69_02680 [bacterium]
MNTMNNDQLIKAVEKFTMQKYLHNLANAQMHKITLFTIFKQTGAPNMSEAVNLIMVDDLLKILSLNSGKFLN